MGEATIRRPLMSGHCGGHKGRVPASEQAKQSCARCLGNGAGNRANPQREYQPCPCAGHVDQDGDLYLCEQCDKVITAMPLWPLDSDGDERYTHLDLVLNDEGEVVSGTGQALGEDCENLRPVPVRAASKEPKQRDCVRCGDTFTPKGKGGVCQPCLDAEAEEDDDFSDLDDLLDEDDFSDLDDLLDED